MLKNKMWLGIILSIILLLFSMNGFTAYYKYTQESGTLFYVASPDKSDALEDTNEVRQILDDLGNLLVHSKRDGSYPEDETTGGTLAIPNSALVSFATGTKGDLFYCSAENTWIKLNIGSDNQILVVATDLPNWETPSSDHLSDVASIAMLDENEAITGAWTITGSIGGVDTTEFGYLADISAFGGSIIDDADEAAFKATVNLEIGTDVLAYRVIGIADDNLVEMDDADAAVDDYCKLTANGVVGRSYSEVKTDLALSSDDLSDVVSIAMLDENETVTGTWELTNFLYVTRAHDTPANSPDVYFLRSRDGDPTDDVSSGDELGRFSFTGWHTDYETMGALIRVIVDGTPYANDMPGRIEFLTTPDGGYNSVLRMKILNTGVIEIYDAGTNLRYTFGVDGTADADVAWGTFSPDVKGEGKELLDIALEDANKPIKPYMGIPVVKKDDELFDLVKEEYEYECQKEITSEDGSPELVFDKDGNPVMETSTGIREVKVPRDRLPNEFKTQTEVDIEYDKYHKVPAKISIANAKYLEYLTGIIDELEARIKVLEKGKNGRIRIK